MWSKPHFLALDEPVCSLAFPVTHTHYRTLVGRTQRQKLGQAFPAACVVHQGNCPPAMIILKFLKWESHCSWAIVRPD